MATVAIERLADSALPVAQHARGCRPCVGIVRVQQAIQQFGLNHVERLVYPQRFEHTVLVVRIASLIVCFHMLQILLWAWFYRRNCFPTWEAAIYFSATSYSTVDASDLVLPRHWRTVGPVDSVPAVLMCGLSASLLFAIVTLLVQRERRFVLEEEKLDGALLDTVQAPVE